VTGGGSGGHITPALAVVHELKQLRPEAHITYVSQVGDTLSDVAEQHSGIDAVVHVRAGKFRRYHGEGAKQILDVKTLYKNLRDALWLVVGIFQSFRLIGKVKPDVIFTRGSFVSVPVCLAAALRGVPYVTHDSDAIPGLANRIIARWARVHAVALPREVYPYPPKKTVTVGVPISEVFRPISEKGRQAERERLGLEKAKQLLFVTGGGNGAARLNMAVANCAPELLERYPGLWIVHLAGRQSEIETRQYYKKILPPALYKRVIVRGFITNLYQFSGAADVVITRAGMTSLAEFAVQAKACIVVPNPQLSGGHQLKNAKVLAERKAVRMVEDGLMSRDYRALMPALTELLDDPAKAQALGAKLAQLAQPNATHLLAMVVLEVVEGAQKAA
jgi:UDP-N-acetylglucosamine--N-acetylmuramyl-(pentapeptide) pyrophosphoryl-undecaprenol N-acetylglucosamine transferase